MSIPVFHTLQRYRRKLVVIGLGLMTIYFASGSLAYGNIIVGTPDTYRALLGSLQAGDTLSLVAGTYESGLPISNRHGEANNPIIITGPVSGEPAVFLGSVNQAWNTVQIDSSSHITIQYLTLDGLDVAFIDAVNSRGVTHHITLDSLEILRHGAHQLTNGIATRGPAWDWIIRNCRIIRAGTGIYLGDSDGRRWPFVGGVIERNLIVDSVGYNMQFKHMQSRTTGNGELIPGMPQEQRNIIVRHNVFSKANQPSLPQEGPRPNLLVGHFPLSGPGSDDVYEIYGNFFFENTTEALFQGEGNIALHNNLFINSSGSAVNIQQHNDVPRSIDVFQNTVVASGSGIRVQGANSNFVQRVIGNAVFTDTPIVAGAQVVQQDNVTDTYAASADYLVNPNGDVGVRELNLFPRANTLSGAAMDLSAFQAFTDAGLDFNGDQRDGTYRGAYAGEVNNDGWALAIDIKPRQVVLQAPSIVTQPESVTVTEGEEASFSVSAVGSGALSYQWFRDGSAITGGTGASYTVMSASSSDDGSVYSSDVSNSLGSVSSSGAVLTVLSDAIAPTLVSAVAASSTRVDIIFSEAVSAGSAQNSANYEVDLGIAVASASLSADERTVSLGVSELNADTAYMVRVSNVVDRAQTPNTIVAQSSESFTYRTADGFEDGTADGWTPLTAAYWSVVMDEGDMAYYLNTTNFASPGDGQLGEYSLMAADFGDFVFTAQAKLGDDVASNSFADYAVVFGFQDAENYYYVMFNNDQGATQLSRVVNGSRVELATASNDWLVDNLYHSIEVRRAASEIEVRFDGNLILSASDSSFGAGRVGVGSFNDSAYFDDISVTATSSLPPPPLDDVAPVITLTGANPQTVTMGGTYTELGATAMDNVDGNISAAVSINASAVNMATAGSYSVTYNVSDAAGNAATQMTRTVMVTAAAVDEPADDSSGGGGALGPTLGLGLMLLALRRRYRHPSRRTTTMAKPSRPQTSIGRCGVRNCK